MSLLLAVMILLCTACSSNRAEVLQETETAENVSAENVSGETEKNIGTDSSAIEESEKTEETQSNVSEEESGAEDIETTEEAIMEDAGPAEEIIIEYDDESVKEIHYYDIKVELPTFHVVKSTEKGKKINLYLETDEGSIFGDEVELHIERDVEFVSDENEVKSYCDKMEECSSILHYKNIKEHDVAEIYAVKNNDENWYWIKYKDSAYMIQTNYPALEWNLVSFVVDDYLAFEMTINKIEACGINGDTMQITSEYDRENNTAIHTIGANKDEKEYVLKTTAKKVDHTYQNELELLQNEEVRQTLTWESREVYDPMFVDLNLDSYVDLALNTMPGVNNDEYFLYTWNAQSEEFERVIYEGEIPYFEVEEGQLRTWAYAGNGYGYVIETLRWEGNTLIKINEEYVEPDKD